jgi:PadR family transcriptional regulator, regulatory protein PadR
MDYNRMIEWLESRREVDDDGHCAAGEFPYRLKPLRLEDLDIAMLQALIRLGDGAYDVPLHCELEKDTGRDVAIGDIYNSLNRLEDQRLISSKPGEPTPERGYQARRYYHVEITGELALDAKLEEAARLARAGAARG